MLKALVVYVNERVKDMGDILMIARATAQKIEHTHENITVKNILYDPVTQVYVAIYESPEMFKPFEERGRKTERRNE